MKTNHFFIGLIFVAMSCQKDREIVATTVQINTTEYFSGDSLGNIVFHIKEPYTNSNYGIANSTNAHGFYFGSFEHPLNKAFEVEVNSSYLNPFPKVQLNSGEHNAVDIKLIDVATLEMELDCSGTGIIQNLHCTPTVYYAYTSPLYGLAEGSVNVFISDCYSEQTSVSLISGQWIISYQWKSDPYATTWTTLSDTIQLTPGQDYIHTIVY